MAWFKGRIQKSNPYQSTRLLLDGQQRLTSLSAVIRGEPVMVRGRKRPIDILFNLEHPNSLTTVTEVDEDAEEDIIEDETDANEDELLQRFNQMTFVVSTRKLEQLPHWVKVSELFNSSSNNAFLKKAGVTSLDDPRVDKYSERLDRVRNIRKYVYRMDVLERVMTYDEVTEIFVRVNSLGAKLRSSDLALAQITAKWQNSLQIFLDFQYECAKLGFDLELGLHLKALVVFATGQSRFKSVSSLSVDTLQNAWKNSCDGMRYALNYLRSNIGIESPALLSSPFLIIVVAYFGHLKNYQINPEDEKQLRYWILTANAKGRFSRGSSETILDQDLSVLKKGLSINELIDKLRQQVGRLDISADELEGRSQRSALFKTMFLAFRASNANDWHTKVKISIDHAGAQHRLQFHHIFPKALLTKKLGISSRDADDIANLAFIGGKTNRIISDKDPADYLPPLIQQDVALFEAQAIPTNLKFLKLESYSLFLVERRKYIAEKLNAYLAE